ncbi:MAG: hypothetical protein DHS20C08_20680 [Rhodomicrobium sp.]|nr:MAG: hypothetical protein DHS20C08_20680 [Rhodomicrobium sp.]
MSNKIKALLLNMALLAGSLLFCFLVFEFVIFKYILKTSDPIPNTSFNNVVRYEPLSKATLYEPDGSSHTVEINQHGWNSSHKVYNELKPAGTTRIAVIGDSYVQASAVNVKEGFADVVEQQLNKDGIKAEVYRFGIDGAPLTQYLHMLRREALKYNPDIVVLQLIHNDFDESYRFLYGRYSSSFMKVKLQGDTITEVAPEPYKPGTIDMLKKSSTFRYLYYQTGLALTIRRLINLTNGGGDKEQAAPVTEPKHGFIQSAVDVRNITEMDKIRRVTAYTFKELVKLQKKHGFKLLIAMDPVREAIYTGKPSSEYEANRLNEIAMDEALKNNIAFLDLGTAMRADYKANEKKFEFPWDWHWNKQGNQIAGQAIAAKLKQMNAEAKTAETSN